MRLYRSQQGEALKVNFRSAACGTVWWVEARVQPLMTVRTERMRCRIWALTPGSSPKPPTP